MPKTKTENKTETNIEEKSCSDCEVCRKELRRMLIKEMPAMFDRTPEITGHLDTFMDKIISIFKK